MRIFNFYSLIFVGIGFLTNHSVVSTRLLKSPSQAYSRSTNKTVQTSLFAIVGHGGLGNVLFELMSLRGSADFLNRKPIINAAKPVIMDMLLTKVHPLFPKFMEEFDLVVLPDFMIRNQYCNFGACCKFENPSKFKHFQNEHVLLEGHYFQSYKYFAHLHDSVQQWLTPDKLSSTRAQMMLPPENRNNLLICAHIRRGDFEDDGVHQPSSEKFTRAGVEYLVEKYQRLHPNRKVDVAILGNDIVWSHSVFHDKTARSEVFPEPAFNFGFLSSNFTKTMDYEVILTPSLTTVTDIAFSRSFCDVFLITSPSSTFGWWLAYLSKPGSKVYYRDIVESGDKVKREMNEDDFYPPQWTKLMTNPLGSIQEIKF